ncbi:hypothetical protein H7849_09810 [Alloacidobacterium dinghuense]|uniref:Flagellar FliJ protein n=1 Tax=Alloacidobacterium dinghuense TaxID=2763107 RepID=A0A7G8BNP1_9BACT|nr:hypothetical protein [Alloacidobacterium dinghuense]QNI34161.1 hypothetical protein H7849_09810 [Alloacidobacterium dinghuense]
MKSSLDRLLRLRSLLEDVSRVELEAQLQEMAQIERALSRAQTAGRAMRQQSFAGISEAQRTDWLVAQAVSEWVTREQSLFESARERKEVQVDAAKAVYLNRRKECRQVANVIDARAVEAAKEQVRREQSELDDWFGQRSRSVRRGNGPA